MVKCYGEYGSWLVGYLMAVKAGPVSVDGMPGSQKVSLSASVARHHTANFRVNTHFGAYLLFVTYLLQ